MAPARPGCAAAGLGCPCCWESRGWRLAWAASPRTCTRQSPGAPSSSPCAVCRQSTVITKHTTNQYSTDQAAAAKVQHAKLCHGTEQYAAPQSVAKHCKAQQYKALQNIAKHCSALHCAGEQSIAKHSTAKHSAQRTTLQSKTNKALQSKTNLKGKAKHCKALQTPAKHRKALHCKALQSKAPPSTAKQQSEGKQKAQPTQTAGLPPAPVSPHLHDALLGTRPPFSRGKGLCCLV